MNETHGIVTLVAQRTREALGEVSLFMYAQNLEAQMGLDYMCSPQVRICIMYDVISQHCPLRIVVMCVFMNKII